MKKLILHIGSGKTGSSSIQRYLSNVKSPDFSFHYDMTGVPAIRDLDEFKCRLLASNSDRVVYSNEWLYGISSDNIQSIYDTLKQDFDVEIYIYLRRQDEFAISAYQQRIKSNTGNRKNSSRYGPIALPQEFPKERLDYYQIVSRWASIFGKDKLNINVYDRELLTEGCVVKDFVHKTGLGLNVSDILNENTSLGLIATKLGHLSNLLELPDGLRQQLISNAPKSAKALPSRDDAIQFYKQFERGNKKLKSEFLIDTPYKSIFNNKWSHYSVQKTDEWNEESANEAIRYLLGVIKRKHKRSKDKA